MLFQDVEKNKKNRTHRNDTGALFLNRSATPNIPLDTPKIIG